ncbi:MAG: hypothetical protein FWC39_13635 [Bacteroidetes bacterium]|nr:hypothetical protein [Bacteroidota bacterium]
MAKITKEQKALVDKERETLFKLLLKKTGWTYNKLVNELINDFVVDNIDVLTSTERKQFKHLAL